jgi:predicted O-methyltransferase YrrM
MGIWKVYKVRSINAECSIKSLSGTFDIIFIDANKDGYISYLDIALSLNLLAPGGLIMADNALFKGLPANKKDNPEKNNPRWTDAAAEMDKFNQWVNERVDLENVLLPAFDGIHFLRRKGC